MAKKKHKSDNKADTAEARRDDANGESPATAPESTGKMKTKDYEREMRRLHGELVAMQEWVKATGARVCIVFEGRDTAGKGGTIKRITERVSPRVFRVVALPAPSEREKSEMYIQRYMPHFPAAGEVVIFDRSWYNRAGVERVMGFCTKEQYERFLELCPVFEKFVVQSGIILIKLWLEVSNKEQERRFLARIDDPLRKWKLSNMDLPSRAKWYEYSRARDAMLKATDTRIAPWHIVRSDDKKRARLNTIAHLLKLIPYKKIKHPKVKLPDRSKKHAYDDEAPLAALLRERATLAGRRVGVVLTGGNIERARFLQVLGGRTPTTGDGDRPPP
jgi:polyphosphate kinase 2